MQQLASKQASQTSLITPDEVANVFNDAVIKELAGILKLNKGARESFAQSVRTDVSLYIEAAEQLSNPALRKEIEHLYKLSRRSHNTERKRGGVTPAENRAAKELAAAVEKMSDQVKQCLARCNPKPLNLPTPNEIKSPDTEVRDDGVHVRAEAIRKLRLILSYGADKKEGRIRPSGKRSDSRVPLLRAPEKREGRPRAAAEREFIRNLALTYLEAKGKRPPYKVDTQARGPFSNFVYKCFELAGAPSGYVTDLINEIGRERRRAFDTNPEFPEDFGAFLDERERLFTKAPAAVHDLSPEDRPPNRVRARASKK